MILETRGKSMHSGAGCGFSLRRKWSWREVTPAPTARLGGEWADDAEKIAHLPKVSLGKRMTRAALEVALKVFSAFVIVETQGDMYFPRHILGGVRHPAVVVLGKAGLEVDGAADVSLVWV
jgi:hypothetical protein